MKYIKYGAIALVVIFIIAVVTADPEHVMRDIQDDVATDFIRQYEQASEHGSEIDRCVRAGLVAEAYLQADLEENYATWRQVQRQDCKAAGMPAM